MASSGASMSGGMAIVQALIANGVDTLFGLPGAQLYPLFDALQQQRLHIRTYTARHEQTCGYMAFGYARATGRPGVYAVVPGPGVLNTAAALVTALGCNAPVLCITGEVPSAFLGRGRGHLHELPDQLATLRSITKWAARIDARRPARPRRHRHGLGSDGGARRGRASAPGRHPGRAAARAAGDRGGGAPDRRRQAADDHDR